MKAPKCDRCGVTVGLYHVPPDSPNEDAWPWPWRCPECVWKELVETRAESIRHKNRFNRLFDAVFDALTLPAEAAKPEKES